MKARCSASVASASARASAAVAVRRVRTAAQRSSAAPTPSANLRSTAGAGGVTPCGACTHMAPMTSSPVPSSVTEMPPGPAPATAQMVCQSANAASPSV